MTKPAETKTRRRLPAHLRRRFPIGGKVAEVEGVLRRQGLHTVCQSAHCPNRGECFGHGTATFMILGNACTRNCRFCAVEHTARPPGPDAREPERIVQAVQALELLYVVITSVTRDDLDLGGADIFAACIQSLRRACPGVRVEVLVPDFQGHARAIDTVLDARPDVFNHNLETVPALYPDVRPQADYRRSLGVLARAAGRRKPARPIVKSGLMVGLGETREQLKATFADLAKAGCEMLTIGQYLAPSDSHTPVVRYLEPPEFDELADLARAQGIAQAISGPFVRSSYHAHDSFQAHDAP